MTEASPSHEFPIEGSIAAHAPRTATIDRSASCARFVYPFAFKTDSYLQRLAALARARWHRGERKVQVWERDKFPEDDLLAHVRHYLNPDDDQPRAASLPTARLLKLTNDALHSPAGLGSQAEWNLGRKEHALPFRWNGVSLAVFHGGIGVLVVDVEPLSDRLDDWLDFLHYFRYIRRQDGVVLEARRRVAKDRYEPFFPEPGGGLDKHGNAEGTMDDLIAALLATAALPEEDQQWSREVFVPGQTMPWAALFVEGLPAEEQPRLLYQVRNFFHCRQELHPTTADLSPEHASILPYVEGQCFLMTREGGTFVACDVPDTPFFRHTLPDHLRKQYFLQFLLIVYQRFFLTRLLDDVAGQWLSPEARALDDEANVFNRLRRRLFTFKSRGYFAQVMQREHHHRCYERWQEVLQVDRLFEEVRDSLRDMHDYLILQIDQQEDRRLERLQWIIGIFGAVIGVPALIFTFFGVNEVEVTGWTKENTWATVLGLLGLGVGTFLILVMVPLLLRFTRRRTWQAPFKQPSSDEEKSRGVFSWLRLGRFVKNSRN